MFNRLLSPLAPTLRASLFGRRIPLWIAGIVAWIAFIGLTATNPITFFTVPALMFTVPTLGAFLNNRNISYAWIDAFPAPALGALMGFAINAFFDTPQDSHNLTILLMGLFTCFAWVFLPIAPRLPMERLRADIQRMAMDVWVTNQSLLSIEPMPTVHVDFSNSVVLKGKLENDVLDGINDDPKLRQLYRDLRAPYMLQVIPDPEWRDHLSPTAWTAPTSSHDIFKAFEEYQMAV